MAFLAPVLAWAGTAAGIGTIAAGAATIGGAVIARSGGQQQAPQIATRNDALERASAADSLARRTGARGQKKTPVGGAEAVTGPKTSLLGRS